MRDTPYQLAEQKIAEALKTKPLSRLPQGGEAKGCNPMMKPENRIEAIQPNVSITSPSPFRGKLEGGF